MNRLASFMDHLIDHHPVMSGLTYPFSAACMVAFLILIF